MTKFTVLSRRLEINTRFLVLLQRMESEMNLLNSHVDDIV
jgi:hypothetical protein